MQPNYIETRNEKRTIFFSAPPSHRLVRSVAQWAVFAMLAGAEKRFFVGVRRPSQWREVGAFVGAVAEGLAFGLAARAPIIGFTGFDVDGEGSFASNMGSGHG